MFKSNLDGSTTEMVTVRDQGRLSAIVLDPVNDKLYLADWGGKGIFSANLDGSSLETIARGVNNPWDLAVDLKDNKLYWNESGSHAIYQANLDGSELRQVTDFGDPYKLAVDSKEEKIYWFDVDSGTLHRANFDGSLRETIIESESAFPAILAMDLLNDILYWKDNRQSSLFTTPIDGGVATETSISANFGFISDFTIDHSEGKIYWILGGLDSGISRANLDGSGVEAIIGRDRFSSSSIALDRVRDKIYWVDVQQTPEFMLLFAIHRANLDGTSEEVLIPTGILESSQSLAIHDKQQKMYWIDSKSNKIQRANLDGSDIKDIVSTGDNVPRNLAIDLAADKLYWTLTNENKIQRSNLDGDKVEDVLEVFEPQDISLRLPFDIVSNVDDEPRPERFDVDISDIYPNPFRQETQLVYDLSQTEHVSITVFDVLGKKVVELENGLRHSGQHVVVWDGRNESQAPAPAGLYLVQLVTESGEKGVSLLVKVE